MGGDSTKMPFLRRLNPKKKRQAVVAFATLSVVVLFLKACSSGKSNSTDANTSLTPSYNSLRKRGESPFFADPPPTPAIVWLQTMPHSASAFVTSLVTRATNLSTATNYGDDVTESGQFSISIDPRESIGPYWPGLGVNTERKLPLNNVLVHNYCKTKSTPHVPSLEVYLQDCVTTFGRTAPDITTLTQHAYPSSRVKKTIHLMRHPLTQIITKFQKDVKAHADNDKWTSKFPDDKEGFTKWCQEEDAKKVNGNWENFSASTVQMLLGTTCSHYIADYIVWHNLAFESATKLQIPSLLIYHEDLLDDKLETTLDRMVDFIEVDKTNMPEQRLGDKDLDVDEYISESDQRQIRRLVQKLATEQTWGHVEHYFEHVL